MYNHVNNNVHSVLMLRSINEILDKETEGSSDSEEEEESESGGEGVGGQEDSEKGGAPETPNDGPSMGDNTQTNQGGHKELERQTRTANVELQD